MKLAGEYVFDAPVEAVWAALFDPAVLAAVMPGCEKLELVNGQYLGDLNIKMGPVQGKFTGVVDLKDVQAPTSYTLVIDGRGAPGFVKATAGVKLEAHGAGTRLTYEADAQVGGKIASIGQRLVDASARAIARQSLEGLNENIKVRVAPPPAVSAPRAAAALGAEPPAPAPPPPVVRSDPGAFAASVAREMTSSLIPVPVRYLLVALAVALVGGLVVYLMR
jgi:carbon monoxide dehydrogenase subunit G